jgi:hypothetical protein
MDLDRPHSGALNNSVRFIESLAALIVSGETFPEVCIYIFRQKQYPFCGIADERLLATALEHIPDGEWFSIVSVREEPLAPCDAIGWGDSHASCGQSSRGLAAGRFVWGRTHSIGLMIRNFSRRRYRSCIDSWRRLSGDAPTER